MNTTIKILLSALGGASLTWLLTNQTQQTTNLPLQKEQVTFKDQIIEKETNWKEKYYAAKKDAAFWQQKFKELKNKKSKSSPTTAKETSSANNSNHQTLDPPSNPAYLPKLTPEELEKQISELEEDLADETISTFLKTKKQTNLFETLKRTKSIRNLNGTFKSLQGTFKGHVILDKTKKTLEVNMHINYLNNSGTLEGNYILSYRGEGRNSKSSGDTKINANNENETFRTLNNNSSEIIIKMSPGAYLHLFYLQYHDTFIGNFYESNSIGSFEKTGEAKLERLEMQH